jgi:hypothetical protein
MPYIYLVHCRASVNASEPVYKIGKSNDFNKRLSGYDKGTIPIFSLYVEECDDFEKTLIKIFETKFEPRKDYGNEYFYGDIATMIKTIIDEYEKGNLCYKLKTETSVPASKQVNPLNVTNTTNLIKTKEVLRKKLNKLNLIHINDFQRNITMASEEYNQCQNYYTLLNSIQQYVYNTQHCDNRLKYGDYMEKNYAFINNICYSAYYNSDQQSLKLIERIKISV